MQTDSYYCAPRKLRCKRCMCAARSRELKLGFFCALSLLLLQRWASLPKMPAARPAPCGTAAEGRANCPLDPCGGLERDDGAPRGAFRTCTWPGGHRVCPGGVQCHVTSPTCSCRRRSPQVWSFGHTCTQATPPHCDRHGSGILQYKQLRRTKPASLALRVGGTFAKTERRGVSKAL